MAERGARVFTEFNEMGHSRINELMGLHKFMADANIKSGSKQAETIMDIWVENKMPYTKQYPKGTSMFDGFLS